MAEELPDNNTGNGTGNDDKAPADKQDGQKKRLAFNTDQIEWVNAHGDTMFGKGFEKAKADYEAKLVAAQKELDELKAQSAKGQKQQPKGQADDQQKKDDQSQSKKDDAKGAESEALAQLRAQIEEMQSGMKKVLNEKTEAEKRAQRLEQEHRGSRIKEAFIDAAKGITFFDPMEVFSLTSSQFDIDDEHGVVVKNPKTGQPRMTMGDNGMRPVTLAEYLNEFANSKPYLVKAKDADGGSGAGGSQKQPSGKDKGIDFAAMTPQEFEAYLQSVKARG
jgi:hypothetical protein